MIASKIRNLDFSLFDFTWGPGTNILSAQGNLISPFLLPIYLGGALFGGDWIACSLVWLQILQIFGAGYAALFYLRQFPLDGNARILASTAFAFSAYSIGGIGQHYFFAGFPFFMALFLGALEQAMRSSKRLVLLSAVTALLCVCSIYAAYMVLLTGGIYTLLRCVFAEGGTAAEKGKRMAGILLSVFIGILLSAIVFLPALYVMLFNSSRVQITMNWAGWLHLNSLPELKSIFLRFFSETMEGNVNSWQGYATAFNVPHLYLSGFAVACIPQHLASLKRTNRKTAIGFLIGYALFFFSLLCPLVGVAYNLFSGYTGRYVFVFFPFAAYAIAKVITDRKENGRFSMAAACVTVFLSAIAFFYRVRSITSFIASAAPVVAVVWLYCLPKTKTERAALLWKAMEKGSLVLVALAVVAEGWHSLYSGRGIVAQGTYRAMYHDSISDTFRSLQKQPGDGFYRSEYVYTLWADRPAYGYAMSMGYHGVSSYNSVTSKRYQAYYRYFGDPYANPFLTAFAYSFGQLGRPLDKTMADLWGIRYVVSTYPESDRDWKQTYIEEMPSGGSIWVLENPDLDSAGTVFYAWYPEEELDGMTDLQRQMALSQAVALDAAPAGMPRAVLDLEGTDAVSYPKTQIEVAGEGTEASIAEQMASLRKDGARYWLTFQAKADEPTTLTVLADAGNGYGENSGQNRICEIRPEDLQKEYVLPLSEHVTAIFFRPSGEHAVSIQNLRIVSCAQNDYTTAGIHSALAKPSGKIVCSVSAERDGIFVMPVCADGGWRAYVDGEPAPVFTADKCFLAVALDAGAHEVVFEYHTPLLKLGAASSLLGLLALAALYRGKKNSLGENK